MLEAVADGGYKAPRPLECLLEEASAHVIFAVPLPNPDQAKPWAAMEGVGGTRFFDYVTRIFKLKTTLVQYELG